MICRPATPFCRIQTMLREIMMIRFLFCAVLLAGPVYAQDFQDTAAVDAAVLGFTGKPIGVEGGARSVIDRRLKLARCPTIALSWRAANHDSVVVSCGAPDWRLYVPVITPPPAAAPAAAAIVPVVTKPVVIIKRGDPVTISAGSAGFSITRDGVAMTEAAAGGRFLVDVDGARKPIQAIAVDIGRATLPGYTQ